MRAVKEPGRVHDSLPSYLLYWIGTAAASSQWSELKVCGFAWLSVMCASYGRFVMVTLGKVPFCKN